MQTLEFPSFGGPLVDIADELFTWGSQWPLPESALLPPEMQGVLDVIGGFADAKAQAVGVSETIAPKDLDPRRAIVLFSGGKDGLAAALKLREGGLRPVLLHVRGINGAAYAHEYEAAKAVAEAVSMPFRSVDVALRGKSAHVENPTKNLALALIGAALAVEWKAGVVALGLAGDDTTSTNVRCGLSDNITVADKGAAAIMAMVRGLDVRPSVVEDETESLCVVSASARHALPVISSCMTGARFKGKLHKDNVEKFGAALMPGRCGSCYKCAFEQIVLAAIDGRTLEPGWAEHCVEKIRKGVQTIMGSAALPSRDDALAALMSDRVNWRHALGI